MKPKTVLLIDHSEAMSTAKRFAMSDLPHEVIATLSFHEATEILRQKPVELVIVDSDLPTPELFATSRNLRKLDYGSQVPILFMTWKGEIELQQIAGAGEILKPLEQDHFSLKPFTSSEFLGLVDRFLADSKSPNRADRSPWETTSPRD